MPILTPTKHTWIEYRGEFGGGEMLGWKGFIAVRIEELGVAARFGYLGIWRAWNWVTRTGCQEREEIKTSTGSATKPLRGSNQCRKLDGKQGKACEKNSVSDRSLCWREEKQWALKELANPGRNWGHKSKTDFLPPSRKYILSQTVLSTWKVWTTVWLSLNIIYV